MGVRGSGASRSSASVADPPAVMAIMRDELPNTQVVILSLSSPDLADGLMRGKIASPSSAMNATRPGSSSPS